MMGGRLSGDDVQSGGGNDGFVVPHFDEPHVDQGSQMFRIDRRQFEALRPDVAQRPAQFDRMLKVKMSEWIIVIGHVAMLTR